MKTTRTIAMASVILSVLLLWTGCSKADAAEELTVYKAGTQQSFKGVPEYFTGEVDVDMLFPPTDHTAFSGAYVTFQPGARTAWHTHPAGQHMIVTSGVGLTQEWGGPIREIREGDAVWCPPDVKHWHGAAPGQSMTHLVITGSKDGKGVTWMEHVTDEQYLGNYKEVEMTEIKELTKTQQAMIPIAAFTAKGDIARLKTAINEGLDAGLTVNEVKEIQIHIYAYAGFPRSLNGLSTLMAVLEERKANEIGKDASPMPTDKTSLELGTEVQTQIVGQPVSGPLYTFAPAIDLYLKSHLFGDIFGRDVLSHQQRELVTLATLASIDGVESQLGAHIMLGMNTGITPQQIKDVITVLNTKVGSLEGNRVETLFQKFQNAGSGKK